MTKVNPVGYRGLSVPRKVWGVTILAIQYMKNAIDVVTCFLVNPPMLAPITDMITV